MSKVNIEKKNNIFIVKLNDSIKGNALNSDSLNDHHLVLEELESAKDNSAVIVTSTHPKSWCVGLDIEWIESQSKLEFEKTFKYIEGIFSRWAMLPLPTIACITGHCIAGGAVLASAMDFRVMRADRGWFAFTEIDVKIPLSPVLYEIANLLPNKKVLRELLLTGRRIGGLDAKNLGIVDEAITSNKLMQRVIEIGEELAKKDLETYRKIKYLLKRDLFQIINKN
tara:strand:- start:1499 stop:2173 length:675 start_codon:yes stop_codon:yes gene_type:complete